MISANHKNSKPISWVNQMCGPEQWPSTTEPGRNRSSQKDQVICSRERAHLFGVGVFTCLNMRSRFKELLAQNKQVRNNEELKFEAFGFLISSGRAWRQLLLLRSLPVRCWFRKYAPVRTQIDEAMIICNGYVYTIVTKCRQWAIIFFLTTSST